MDSKKGVALLLGMPHDEEDSGEGPSDDDKQKAAEDTFRELGEAFKGGDLAGGVEAFKRLCQLTEEDEGDEDTATDGDQGTGQGTNLRGH